MRADLESCRSGRSGRIRNPLYPQGYPGFESLALRQINKKPSFGWVFCLSGEPSERTLVRLHSAICPPQQDWPAFTNVTCAAPPTSACGGGRIGTAFNFWLFTPHSPILDRVISGLWTYNMLKTMLPRLLALTFALLLLPVTTVGAQSVDKVELDPEQARQVLDTLQDEERIEDVVRALEVIASEEPVEEVPPVVEEESPLSTIVPLEEGGLVARTLDQVAEWADGLRAQLVRIGLALGELPAWFQ